MIFKEKKRKKVANLKDKFYFFVMPNFDLCQVCCCCSCFICIFMIFLTLIGNFLSFWDYVDTPFAWFSYLFWKFWNLIFLLFRYFIFNVFPYAVIIYACYKFDQFMYDQIVKFRNLKNEMNKYAAQQKYYVIRLKDMKLILLYIFEFLVVLRFVTWYAFSDSLIMEVVTIFNVGVLMSMVLMGKVPIIKDLPLINRRREEEIVVYNCFLIFISSFIIDDLVGMVTGKTIINFNVFSK